MNWSAWIHGESRRIKEVGQWRELGIADPVVTSYASNDYLGWARDPRVIEAACAAARRFGTSASASSLLRGRTECNDQLETAIAEWKCTESAVLFPTGYSTNLAAVSALADANTTVISDELNHASLIDGARISRAQIEVLPHNNMDCLGDKLARSRGRVLIVTDDVFSMDGDCVRLEEMTSLAELHGNAMVLLDEAHSLPMHSSRATVLLQRVPHVRIGTLSKTLGSIGGFVAGSNEVVDFLVNRARALIFSTGLPPSAVAAAACALELSRSAEGAQRERSVLEMARVLDPNAASPIIPVVIGEAARTTELSRRLLDRGCYVPAVRPPTVPIGTSRLRIAVNATHTTEQIEVLREVLTQEGLWPQRSR